MQNLLSSSFLTKNIKLMIYTTIILLVFLYGCETLSLISTEELRLRIIFGSKRAEMRSGES